MSKSVARTKLLVAACAAALLAAGCNPSGPGNAASRSPSASASADQLEQEYQRVVKNVLPSVVQITTGSALGSGIVYDDKGDIVTNAHVVGNSTDFEVTLPNNDKVLKATLLSSYPAQDLAVIKLNNPLKGLRAAKFGDSSKVEVGQITLAMGSPLGLSGSVTQGIVSAVGRTVSEGQSGGGTGATIENMVQTSAPINPGNSGGALVNLSGEVIGIPTLAATDPDLGNSAAAGIGFAIPASTVTRVANQIIKNGKVTDSGRAALGIVGRTVLNADFEPAGVAIVSVVPGGPADKAGLRAGDIITKVGNTAVTTIQSLSEALVAYTPGNKVKVTYERDGKTATVTVALGKL